MIHVITNGDEQRKLTTIQACSFYGWNYTFHEFPRNKQDGRQGCFDSHVSLWKYADEHQMDYIWIGEDNMTSSGAKLTSSYQSEIDHFLKGKKWNVLYMGGWFPPLCNYKDTSYFHINQTNHMHGTSMYIIHKRLYKRLLTLLPDNKHQASDSYITSHSKQHSYILYPLLIYRNNKLATTNKYSFNWIQNKITSILHHPRVLQFQEKMIRHGWLSYRILFVFIIVIATFCIGYLWLTRKNK